LDYQNDWCGGDRVEKLASAAQEKARLLPLAWVFPPKIEQFF
jgi:hypothetical protein